jgi:hypothetical protein
MAIVDSFAPPPPPQQQASLPNAGYATSTAAESMTAAPVSGNQINGSGGGGGGVGRGRARAATTTATR